MSGDEYHQIILTETPPTTIHKFDGIELGSSRTEEKK